MVSAQQTIPYVAMYPDGVCQLPGGLFTKTVEYEDINYSVASTEDQSAIFNGWSAFLNYFDSALPFQLSFVNRRSHAASRYKVNIPMQADEFDSIRGEFVSMLKGQIAKSNNGIDRAKYITFGVPAWTLGEARPRQPAPAWCPVPPPGRTGAAGGALQPDPSRQPGALPFLLEGHLPHGHGHQGCRCPQRRV